MLSSLTSDHWALRSRFWLAPLLAAGVRIALIAAGPAPEVWEYDAIARSVLAGDGYVYPHFGQPQRAYYSGVPYVLLTAGTYHLWPERPKAMLVVQAMLAMVTAALVVGLASCLGNPLAGLVAGVLTALHPALVYYDVRKLHPLGLDALLSVAPILVLVARPTRWTAALAGVLIGLGVLQRGSLLPLALFALAWLGSRPGTRRERLVRALAFIGAVAIVVAPWLYRNQRVFGRPRLVTGNGYRFFIGNVPPSQGSALLPSGQAVIDVADPDLRRALPAQDELGQDRLFWQRGSAFVHAHPATFVGQVARKLVYFWTLTPATGALYPRLYRNLYLAFYGCVLLAAIVGAATLARTGQRRSLLLIAALFLSVSAVHAVFYVELRHRWALEPLLLVLAAVGVSARRDSDATRPSIRPVYIEEDAPRPARTDRLRRLP
jgi:hypothetical protein